MKTSKKLLIGALATATGLAAATGVTSGFAWFASNTSVNVSGLQMKVAAVDNAFLIIGDGAKQISGRDNYSIREINTNDNADLYPAAHEAVSTTSFDWYWLTSTKPGEAQAWGESDTRAKNTIKAPTTFGDIVVGSGDTAKTYANAHQYTVAVAKGSSDATNLSFRNFAITTRNNAKGDSKTIDAVRVLFVLHEFSLTTVLWSGEASGATPTTAPKGPKGDVILDTVLAGKDYVLDTYLYVDGNDAAVTSNNAANLDGASVSFELSVGA